MQYAYPLLAIFIWAGNTVVNKLAVGSIFPAEIGFYRWLLAALLFTRSEEHTSELQSQ